jgi:AraC-like DNA-binding protein
MEYYTQPEINIYRTEYETDCSYWTFSNVSAPYWRFYWCLNSGGIISYKGKRFVINPQSFILIPPNTCFSTKAERKFKQFYVHFTAAAPFDQVFPDIYIFQMTEVIREKILKAIEFIPDSQDEQVFKILLFSIVFDALLQLPDSAFDSSPAPYDSRIIKIVDLLDKNTSWSFSNEELASKANMSVNGFIRLFSIETGISPQQYSRRQRINKACMLLHFSKDSIDEIARKTGFQDRYYFSRVFKQITNHSPAQFRKVERPIK